MGEDNRQQMDTEHHQPRISDTLRSPSTVTTNTFNPLSTGHINSRPHRHRPGGTGFTGQESDRRNPWSWFQFTPIHHPKEDRRSATRPQSATIKPIRQTAIIQDGDNPAGMPNDPTECLYDIHRFTGRISSYINPFLLTALLTVPMAGQSTTVQIPSLRIVSEPVGVYQGTPSRPSLGTPPRNPHIGLFRRFDHRWQDQGANGSPHNTSSQKARRARIPLQGRQIPSHTHATARPLGFQDQQPNYESIHSPAESQGPTPGGHALTEDTHMHSPTSGSVHWEGSGDNTSRLSGTPTNLPSTTAQEPRSNTGTQLAGLDPHNTVCSGEPELVGSTPDPMESLRRN